MQFWFTGSQIIHIANAVMTLIRQSHLNEMNNTQTMKPDDTRKHVLVISYLYRQTVLNFSIDNYLIELRQFSETISQTNSAYLTSVMGSMEILVGPRSSVNNNNPNGKI